MRRFYYDLHIHTKRHSACSTMAPEEAVAAARTCGLDGIAFTEHARVWSGGEIAELRARCGAPPTFVILSGCEISTRRDDSPTGDVLVFGAARLPGDPCTIAELVRAVHGQGGIVIPAHPYAGVMGMGDALHSTAVDAVEAGNFHYRGRQDPRRLAAAWRQSRLPGIAVSDAHALSEIGQFCTEFEGPVSNERELIEAIRRGSCRPRLKSPPSQFWRWVGL